jgi:signal transduction histidine kinase
MRDIFSARTLPKGSIGDKCVGTPIKLSAETNPKGDKSPASPEWRRGGAPFLRSAGVRFAILYALLFGASVLALAVFIWWATAGLLDRQTDAAIRADAQGLAERWDEGGVVALVATIKDRLIENVDDHAIYLLTDRSMQPLAGNLSHWPASVSLSRDWDELPIERAGIRSMARVHRFDVQGGYHLLIGRDVQIRAQMRNLLTDALLWAGGVVLVLGTAGALVVRSLFRQTLARVSSTAAAISAGDLTQRVKLSGRGDEFDRLAETINDMLDRIARLMDGVREVSNAIAHDLRTPITRARTRLEDAATHAQGEDALRAAIERATADLDGVVAVFLALLRIAEIEAGARRSAFAALDLAPLLSDLAELYSAAAEEAGLSLELRVTTPLPMFGDRELIQQAVANLLDNAIKFSPQGGRIYLSADKSDMIRVTVRDAGPGMPDIERARATERFFRGELARNTPGSGLGLSLVEAVALLHGGHFILSDAGPGLIAEIELAFV